MTTTINTDGNVLEFTGPSTKVSVAVMVGKTLYGHVWYEVNVFDKLRGDWFQMSRYEMAKPTFQMVYDYLAVPQMSETALNKEHVSFEAFKALVQNLKQGA